jgi:hypothetical protein
MRLLLDLINFFTIVEQPLYQLILLLFLIDLRTLSATQVSLSHEKSQIFEDYIEHEFAETRLFEVVVFED